MVAADFDPALRARVDIAAVRYQLNGHQSNVARRVVGVRASPPMAVFDGVVLAALLH